MSLRFSEDGCPTVGGGGSGAVERDLALLLPDIHLPSMLVASGSLAVRAGSRPETFVRERGVFVSDGILRREMIRLNDLVLVDGRWLIVQSDGPRTDGGYDLRPRAGPSLESSIGLSSVENPTRNNLVPDRDAGRRARTRDLDLVRKTGLEEAIYGPTGVRQPLCTASPSEPSTPVHRDFDVEVWESMNANDARGRRSDLHDAVWRAARGTCMGRGEGEGRDRIAYPQSGSSPGHRYQVKGSTGTTTEPVSALYGTTS